MYAKIENDTVVQYPYGITRLRDDHPNTSFPVNFLDSPEAADYNVAIVKDVPRPKKAGFKYVDTGPVMVDGAWTQVWEEQRKELDELTALDIHEVEAPEQEFHWTLDAGPSWDGEKYVQSYELIPMNPIEKRVQEYGSVERQIEFITEQGLEAWQAEVARIKEKHPK